ncbi:AlpA family transcriptional regulator [Parahaliea maris]|uniref:AlpA family transcriptional regulator n=1 Tax=Parahaliea maris TaxID=2716870 RepID=A0A5C9ABP5_9GAMM|nr:AlpA family transcriptional regulator [Parahaliea maris]
MRLIRLPEVRSLTGLSRTHIYRLVAAEEFPAPLKLGGGERTRASGWLEVEVLAWIESRIAERQSA